jgi:hypothetical protein
MSGQPRSFPIKNTDQLSDIKSIAGKYLGWGQASRRLTKKAFFPIAKKIAAGRNVGQ